LDRLKWDWEVERVERHLAHVDALNERAAQVDNLLQEKKEMIKRKEELEKEFEVARVDAEVRGKEQRCVLRRLMLRRRSSRPRPAHARTLARSHARTLLISLARLTFCREAHEAEIARLQREIDSNKEALARKDRELEDERARVRAQLNRYVVLTGCSID
jgi:hypothetical protein